MKHGISPTRDPKMWGKHGIKVGVVIRTHATDPNTKKRVPWHFQAPKVGKSGRRREKAERIRAMYRAYTEEKFQRGEGVAFHYHVKEYRTARDRDMSRWHREDRI